MEKTKSLWASTEEVCSATGIGRTRLMDLKAAGDLTAGQHWVYLTGRKRSPLGWDLEAVCQWQRQKSVGLAKASDLAVAEIEDYAPMVEA